MDERRMGTNGAREDIEIRGVTQANCKFPA